MSELVVPRAKGRLPELDSLRGLAAFTVVLLHFVLMWPGWLNSVGIREFRHIPMTLLYPLYAGHEAVMLFFVLSGLVLALPFLNHKAQPYPVFVVRRVLRIYGPYVVALGVAVAGAAIWHGHIEHGAWASTIWSNPVSPRLIVQHIVFLCVYDWSQFNVVIWSLIYEMRISLIFPLLIALVARCGTKRSLAIAATGSLVALAASNHHDKMSATYNVMMTLHYSAFFILGILLATHLDRIGEWFRAASRAKRIAFFAGSFGLYELCGPLDHIHPRLVSFVIGDWGVAVGAIGLIVVGLNSQRVSSLLRSPVPAFLGRISYSLYLIHSLVLMALTFGLRDRVSPTLQLPLYLAVAIASSYLFCRMVEEPFMRLGQRFSKSRSARPVGEPVLPSGIVLGQAGENA